MSFFKKLFGGNKVKKENLGRNSVETEDKIPKEIFTEDYFNNRYIEENLYADTEFFEGNFKMMEGYFIDMKVEKPIQNPTNHPENLDALFENLINFKLYCNGFQMEDKMVAMTLSSLFSDFLIKKYGFKLYKDTAPEYPLRFLSLKYNKNGVVLSLYPFEYSVKVMNLETTYTDLENKIKDKLEIMPDYKKVVDDILNK